MPTREELHKLIDSLPEGAFDAGHRALSNLQVYKHEVTGPCDKRDEREIVFELA